MSLCFTNCRFLSPSKNMTVGHNYTFNVATIHTGITPCRNYKYSVTCKPMNKTGQLVYLNDYILRSINDYVIDLVKYNM